MSSLQGVTSSGLKTSDTTICTRECYLHTIVLDPPSSGVATLTVYDSANSTTSGKNILWKMEVSAGTSSDPQHFTTPVNANQGIHCVFTGTDSGFIIHYSI